MRDESLESTPSGRHVGGAAASPARALVLATISFTFSFAAWGLIGGLASVFTGLYRLTASETALLVAVPVLLGSFARLPMGMLTDRFGGRLVFTALLAFSSLAAFVVPLTGSYGSLLSRAVIPRPAEGTFYCPCHEGRFDLRTGAPTAGPPRRPLTRIVLDIRGRDIYAVGVEERTI